MLLTVRDEERFLAANLAYHRAMGVARAYVFLDRCTDASRQIAQSFPWVQTIDRDRQPNEPFFADHHDRCANRALELARAEGFEWLMCVDADEFAFGQGPSRPFRWPSGRRPWGRASRPEVIGSLPRMLARVRPSTEQVVMLTMEVVQTPLRDGEPFWKLYYFQARGALKRQILDPTTGEVRPVDRWLGHRVGKSIVRTSADVHAAGPHRWTCSRARADCGSTGVATEYRGSLYHFVVVGAAHWREKYGKLAELSSRRRRGNPVHFPKQAWKEASVAMSEAEARAYYDRWVVVRPRDLIWPRLRGDVVYEPVVEKILTIGPDRPPRPTPRRELRS